MKVTVTVETKVSRSARARQVEALFDVPAGEKCKLNWTGEVPVDDDDWNVGLIVGPSGSGKTTVARHLFGEHYHPELQWSAASVIDDFDAALAVKDIASACSSVGFNTVPAWLRPYAVLSNGERFRVDIARRLLEVPDPVVVDEFTSVVDRQVAKIGSHAIQKFVRRNNRKFVAVGCHFDVIDWLQPDWILEPATMSFQRRSVQRRPEIEVTIQRVPYSTWQLFAPYHYMTASLHRAARCYGSFVGETPVAFVAILPMPHPKTKNLRRISRVVCLPDWQGLGLGPSLSDTISAAYKAIGYRMRAYPAHPAYVAVRQRSPHWRQVKQLGQFAGRSKSATRIANLTDNNRPCAVFEYVGPAWSEPTAARKLVG